MLLLLLLLLLLGRYCSSRTRTLWSKVRGGAVRDVSRSWSLVSRDIAIFHINCISSVSLKSDTALERIHRGERDERMFQGGASRLSNGSAGFKGPGTRSRKYCHS